MPRATAPPKLPTAPRDLLTPATRATPSALVHRARANYYTDENALLSHEEASTVLSCRAMEASHAHAGAACCVGAGVGTKSLVGSLGSTYAACTSIVAMFNADGACAG